MRERKKFGKIKEVCSKCNNKIEIHRQGKQRYCLSCHAASMRSLRPKHRDLPDERRKKANSRSYANEYLRRGKIIRQPCQVCGEKAQMHHDDYSKPTQVRWFCREHHLQLHKTQK